MTTKPMGPYEASFTSQTVYGVKGPGDGIGYYAAYAHPENTFENWDDAVKTARLMNLAFVEGQRDRSRAIMALLE